MHERFQGKYIEHQQEALQKVISPPPCAFESSVGNTCGSDTLPPRKQGKTKPFVSSVTENGLRFHEDNVRAGRCKVLWALVPSEVIHCPV